MIHRLLRHTLIATLALSGCVGQESPDETDQSQSAIGTPGALNTTLVGRYDFGADQNTRDVAISGSTAYVARRGDGFAVVDISNRAAPALVTVVNPAPGAVDARDVSVLNIAGTDYLFVANNSGVVDPSLGNFTGVYIYSLATPTAPAFVRGITWGAGPAYHLAGQSYVLTTATVGGRAYLFAGSLITSSLEVFDVTDPALPVWITSVDRHNVTSFSSICDAREQNGRLYVAWREGWAVYDITGLPTTAPTYGSPVQPPMLAVMRIPTGAINTAVPNATGDYVLTTDDRSNGRVRMWDIRNPNAITVASTFGGTTNTVARQVVVQGNLAWVTHHQDGLRVFDIANPAAPVSLAWFDTDVSTPSNARVGGWDVIPDGNTAWLTDTADGLHAVNIQDTITVQNATWYRQRHQLVVYASSTLPVRSTLTVAGFGAMAWSATNNRYELTAAANTNPVTITVTSSYGASVTASVTRRN